MFLINEKAAEAISVLEKNGFEAYIVGGYIRDALMNRYSNDIDITTNAKPDQILECFRTYKTVKTGIKHGTVSVIIKDTPVEITTYRCDGTYSDNRHPDAIEFCSDLKQDLARRDFTINAIAYNEKASLVDLYGGADDINAGIIRAIGDPETRFQEDSLRILRALRFMSVLNFTIDTSTKKAIHKCKGLISNIAKERICAELRKMVCGNNIKNVLLEYPDVFGIIIPEISLIVGFEQHNYHHKYDIYTHTAVVVENTPPKDYLRLSALLHDIAKPETFFLDGNQIGHFYSHASKGAQISGDILRRLKFDNHTVKMVETLVKAHDSPIAEDKKVIRRKLNKYGASLLYDLISLQKADTYGLADRYHERLSHFERLKNLIADVVEEDSCFSLKSLAINGNDVKALGFTGKDIGCILNKALNAVVDEKIRNDRMQLLEYIKAFSAD